MPGSRLFAKTFIPGVNSSDPRKKTIKASVSELLNRFGNDEIYNADPDSVDYTRCFSNEIHAIYAAASVLVVVERIRSGNISKSYDAVKAFIRDHAGRSRSSVRIAYAVRGSHGDVSL